MKVKELIEYGEKSKIKAGEAVVNGKYQFFTSSEAEDKRYNEYTCDTEGIIMGTGGNATLHYCSGKFAVSTDCLVLKTNEKVNCKYLYYFFKANMSILQAGFKGAGLKHTNKNYIENIEISRLPDINQQKHIVYKLEKVESIIKKQNRILDYFDTLIKARFVEMFGDPISNSKNYKLKKLIELGELGRGVSKHRPRNDPKLLGGKYPLIQTGDVANADTYIKSYSNTYSEMGLQQSKMWKEGTLCITIAANIASTAIMLFDACFPDSVVGFNANGEVDNIYIHYWFTFFQSILEKQAPAVAQKNINLQILSELKVIVPNKSDVESFAAFVKEVDKLKVA